MLTQASACLFCCRVSMSAPRRNSRNRPSLGRLVFSRCSSAMMTGSEVRTVGRGRSSRLCWRRQRRSVRLSSEAERPTAELARPAHVCAARVAAQPASHVAEATRKRHCEVVPGAAMRCCVVTPGPTCGIGFGPGGALQQMPGSVTRSPTPFSKTLLTFC
jgi:hypothetical protein